jgi:hypothetical protein
MLLFVKGLLKEWPHSRIRVVNRFAPTLCDVKIFLTFTSPNMILL